MNIKIKSVEKIACDGPAILDMPELKPDLTLP